MFHQLVLSVMQNLNSRQQGQQASKISHEHQVKENDNHGNGIIFPLSI